jgi:hypothetical protein
MPAVAAKIRTFLDDGATGRALHNKTPFVDARGHSLCSSAKRLRHKLVREKMVFLVGPWLITCRNREEKICSAMGKMAGLAGKDKEKRSRKLLAQKGEAGYSSSGVNATTSSIVFRIYSVKGSC